MKNAKFLNLGKSASYLGTDASDRKMDVEFVISDHENLWAEIYWKKFFFGVAQPLYTYAGDEKPNGGPLEIEFFIPTDFSASRPTAHGLFLALRPKARF